MPFASLDEIRALIGQEIGVSSWIEVGQPRIDTFADATEDHQFIHVDPEAAAKAGLGGTIAHGFLSLSLMSRMAADVMIVSTARTGVGRAYRGAFNATPSPTLAAHPIRAAVERAKIDPAEIDDVIMGAALQQGVQTTIGRTAALRAGLPVTVAGMS